MSDSTTNIIYKVELDTADTQEEINTMTVSVNNLAKANTALTTSTDQVSSASNTQATALAKTKDAMDKNKQSATDHSAAIGKLKGAVDGLVPGLGQVADGLDAGTKAALKFIATPIGAIIAAVVLAIAALSQYFTRTEEGGDLLAKSMAQLGAIFNVILDRAAALGGALVKLFSGDFIGAAEAAKKAVSGIGDEIDREVKSAGELADLLDQIEDREVKNSVAVAESANAIKNLVIQSKNRNLTEQQRIDLLDKATELEKAQAAQSAAISLAKLAAANQQFYNDNNQFIQAKKAGESEIDFATRAIASDNTQIDQRKKLAQALIDYNAILGDSLNIQDKIANQTQAQYQKQQAAADALNAKIDAQNEKIADAGKQYQIDQDKKVQDDLVRQQKADAAKEAEQNRNIQASAVAVSKSQAKADQEFKKSQDTQTKINTATAQARLRTENQVVSETANLFGKQTIAYKIAATSQTLIATYQGATQAFASLSGIEFIGPILGAAAAALAIASGLENVAKIDGFVDGGLTGTRVRKGMGANIHRSNGDNILATVRTGEVILNQKHQAMLGGDATFRSMGIPGFAASGVVGQYETRQAVFGQATSNANMQQLADAIYNTPPVAFTSDLDKKQAEISGPRKLAAVLVR